MLPHPPPPSKEGTASARLSNVYCHFSTFVLTEMVMTAYTNLENATPSLSQVCSKFSNYSHTSAKRSYKNRLCETAFLQSRLGTGTGRLLHLLIKPQSPACSIHLWSLYILYLIYIYIHTYIYDECKHSVWFPAGWAECNCGWVPDAASLGASTRCKSFCKTARLTKYTCYCRFYHTSTFWIGLDSTRYDVYRLFLSVSA